MDKQAQIRLVQFSEYDDLVARIYSDKGSSPIALRTNGVDATDEQIGRRFREAVTYHLPTEQYQPGDKL